MVISSVVEFVKCACFDRGVISGQTRVSNSVSKHNEHAVNLCNLAANFAYHLQTFFLKSRKLGMTSLK